MSGGGRSDRGAPGRRCARCESRGVRALTEDSCVCVEKGVQNECVSKRERVSLQRVSKETLQAPADLSLSLEDLARALATRAQRCAGDEERRRGAQPNADSAEPNDEEAVATEVVTAETVVAASVSRDGGGFGTGEELAASPRLDVWSRAACGDPPVS